jgi:hypothetical protein
MRTRIDSDPIATGVDDSLFSLAYFFEEPELHPICAIDEELQRYLVQRYLILTGLFCNQTTSLGSLSFGSARSLYFRA